MSRLRHRARGWLRSRGRARAPAAGAEELIELERRLVWIFGSPRSGSTWLMRLLADACEPRAVMIDEPRAGEHLALMEPVADGVGRANDRHAKNPSYLFSRRYRDAWAPATRRLLAGRLLAEATDQGAAAGPSAGPVIVKEPNGSQGADLIVELMPEARVLHLLRDPADVLDSQLDGVLHGVWTGSIGPDAIEAQRLAFLRQNAALYVHRLGAIERAIELADTRGLTVRYEDLLADPAGELTRILAWIGEEPDPDRVASAVARHDFAATPAAERGPGHSMRAATPGLWRQNLSPAEQDLIQTVLGDLRRRLDYP